MNMIFNADEVLKIAEQIERNGVTFYERAAARFRGDEKRTLLRLADMERSHEKFFANMRSELAEAGEALTAFDPDGESTKYLAAFANGQIFDLEADPLADLGPQDSDLKILEIAIGLEKESVIFYSAIRDAVPEGLGKGKIEEIIKEEMEHIVLLSGTLASLRE